MVEIQNIRVDQGRVVGEIAAGGGVHRLSVAGKEIDLQPSPEAFVLLALPAAMKLGQPLCTGIPVSRRLLSQLHDVQSLYCQWQPSLRKIEINAPTRADENSATAGEALFFTGGVDSFYSALRLPAAALVFAHGLDIPLQDVSLRRKVSERLREAADQLGRPFIELETNLRDFSDIFMPWQLAFGGALASLGYFLGAQAGRFGIAASYSIGDETTAGRELPDGSHPRLVSLFSTQEVDFRSVGTRARRIDKLQALGESASARHALRVCWENRGGAYNCGVCEKCLRTMAALQALGCLEDFSCFDRPLDYLRLARSVPVHPSSEIFVRENLQMAIDKGHDEQLVRSLRASLESPFKWIWWLYAKCVPRRLKHMVY